MQMILGVTLSNGLMDRHETMRLMLQRMNGLIIPADKFAGKRSIELASWFSSRSGGGRALTYDDYRLANHDLYQTDRFLYTAQPMSGALEALIELRSRYELWVVSKVAGLSEERLTQWLKKHEFPISRIVLTRGGPKTSYYEQCNAIVESEVEDLHPLGHRTDVLQTLLLPPPGATCEKFVSAPSRRHRFVKIAKGWPSVLEDLKAAA